MQTNHVSCRLFVILAREAPVGVIFRRGPSRWVQIIKWHTDSDKFEPGAWFSGRIYERRCDLSPDGTKLVYFAQRLQRKTSPDYTYAWTAISKMPWLTALALWPKGNCWSGGGVFINNDTLLLNHEAESSESHKNHTPPNYIKVISAIPEKFDVGENWPIYGYRLVHDGWVIMPELKSSEREQRWQHLILEKPHPVNPFRLILKSVYDIDFPERFAIKNESCGTEKNLQYSTWADWDQRGRLVFAKEGRLFAGDFDESGSLLSRELADFNGNKPERTKSPDWARIW